MSDNYEKISILPLEGENKTAIFSQFNPKELSFTKSVGWSDDSVGCETDYPALQFTAGQAISLSVELFFDKYEEAGDVRDEVGRILRLCEIQTISGAEKRPPRVQLLWGESSPIVKGKSFTGVVEQAQAKYTMFLSNGTPCRASVTVTIKQADVVGTQTKDGDNTSATYDTSNWTPQTLSNVNGGVKAVEDAGGKADDPSTYPNPLIIKADSGDSEE